MEQRLWITGVGQIVQTTETQGEWGKFHVEGSKKILLGPMQRITGFLISFLPL